MTALLKREQEGIGHPSSRIPPSFVTGWSGLPSALNSIAIGGAYSLSLRPTFSRVRLIFSLLKANLNCNSHCVVITPQAPEAFLRRCGSTEQSVLRTAIAEKRLLLFSLLDDTQKNIFRFGIERLLKELSLNGVNTSHLIIVDQAEHLFSMHHRETALAQLDTYKTWLLGTECAALFLFSNLGEDKALSWTHCALAESMQGCAYLGMAHGEAELWVDFWQANEEVIAEYHAALPDLCWSEKQTNARVAPLPQSDSFSGHSSPFTNKRHVEADDADDIYCLGDFQLPFLTGRVWNWQPVQSLIGLVHATRHAQAATTIVNVSRNTDWIELAQTVHAIRSRSGAALRIIILDKDHFVRYQHEALLLRAGANLVLQGPDVFMRLPLYLDSLQNQCYLQNSACDFSEALVSASPTQAKGYLSPAAFCSAVRQALLRARALQLPCAMVILPNFLYQELPMSQGQLSSSRPGDFVTVAPHHCFLFFYSCATNDYPELLHRLIGPVSTTTQEEVFFFNEQDTILEALHPLVEGGVSDALPIEAHPSRAMRDVIE